MVEDDERIAEPLVEGLTAMGFSITWVTTGAEALQFPEPEVVLLDLGLPDVDGMLICRELRHRAPLVSIIVITARSDEEDRVIGLDSGADDYVVKPFGLRELEARIRAVSRRALVAGGLVEGGLQDLGRLVIDHRAHRVLVNGAEVALTPKEFAVLAVLAEDQGAVVNRQVLFDEVWDPHWYGPTKTLDVHVASLRRRLGHPEWIETVRGVGLRLGRTD